MPPLPSYGQLFVYIYASFHSMSGPVAHRTATCFSPKGSQVSCKYIFNLERSICQKIKFT